MQEISNIQVVKLLENVYIGKSCIASIAFERKKTGELKAIKCAVLMPTRYPGSTIFLKKYVTKYVDIECRPKK